MRLDGFVQNIHSPASNDEMGFGSQLKYPHVGGIISPDKGYL